MFLTRTGTVILRFAKSYAVHVWNFDHLQNSVGSRFSIANFGHSTDNVFLGA